MQFQTRTIIWFNIIRAAVGMIWLELTLLHSLMAARILIPIRAAAILHQAMAPHINTASLPETATLLQEQATQQVPLPPHATPQLTFLRQMSQHPGQLLPEAIRKAAPAHPAATQ